MSYLFAVYIILRDELGTPFLDESFLIPKHRGHLGFIHILTHEVWLAFGFAVDFWVET